MNQKRLWRSDDNAFADEMADGIFLLSEDGEIFVIDDPVGKFLWNQLADGKCSLDMLIECIKEKFTSGTHNIEDDVNLFIESLAEARLITCDGE